MYKSHFSKLPGTHLSIGGRANACPPEPLLARRHTFYHPSPSRPTHTQAACATCSMPAAAAAGRRTPAAKSSRPGLLRLTRRQVTCRSCCRTTGRSKGRLCLCLASCMCAYCCGGRGLLPCSLPPASARGTARSEQPSHECRLSIAGSAGLRRPATHRGARRGPRRTSDDVISVSCFWAAPPPTCRLAPGRCVPGPSPPSPVAAPRASLRVCAALRRRGGGSPRTSVNAYCVLLLCVCGNPHTFAHPTC